MQVAPAIFRRTPYVSRPMADLFPEDLPHSAAPDAPREDAPLADRLRPATLGEVIGQDHLTPTL